MTLQIFETEDAIYYLGLGNHFKSSAPFFEDVDFSELEFTVFESNGRFPLEKRLETHPQYGKIYNKAIKENPDIKFYTVDVDTSYLYVVSSSIINLSLGFCGFIFAGTNISKIIKEKQNLSRRDFLKGAGKISAGTILASPYLSILNGYSGKYGIPFFDDLNSINTNILPLDHSFRDAVWAKKISEYLVPKHKRDGKKVKAAIVCGAFHSGVELKIKFPKIADLTISLYQDLFDYIPKKHINEVREITKTKYGLKTVFHDSKLF